MERAPAPVLITPPFAMPALMWRSKGAAPSAIVKVRVPASKSMVPALASARPLLIFEAVAAAASYVVSNASIIEEVDVNPLMVLPAGDGVVAADALIRLRKNP